MFFLKASWRGIGDRHLFLSFIYSMMQSFGQLPDLSDFGYQVISSLRPNRGNRRVTYLAIPSFHGCDRPQKDISNPLVAIEKLPAHPPGNSEEYEDKINLKTQELTYLRHPHILRYRDSFILKDNIYLVRDYRCCKSLDDYAGLPIEKIEKIAISILKILVALQERIAPILHRDIRPENLLIDRQFKVYLVGFAIAGVDFTADDPFLAPEVRRGAPFAKGSDLYSLGVTILAGFAPVDLPRSLLGDRLGSPKENRPALKQITQSEITPWPTWGPSPNSPFGRWLQKLTDPDPERRYLDAIAALRAIAPAAAVRTPQIQLSHDRLELHASDLTHSVTQTITIGNEMPGTVLEGSWEVAPHPNDPPHTPEAHPWISFKPSHFKSNFFDCQVTVNPRQLSPDECYRRQLILRCNSEPPTYAIALELRTAAAPDITQPRDRPEMAAIAALVVGLIVATVFSGKGMTFGTIAATIAIVGNPDVRWGFPRAESHVYYRRGGRSSLPIRGWWVVPIALYLGAISRVSLFDAIATAIAFVTLHIAVSLMHWGREESQIKLKRAKNPLFFGKNGELRSKSSKIGAAIAERLPRNIGSFKRRQGRGGGIH
ncbi:protein kinase domain-containing protein [Oxynema aestuarii]|uniref:non-specific serine/threonine protein kinase n=1 Tax=Oxynema aestuarii AP17 TaxID=2064643 RepID=A0A6H1TUK8_9CYAN|nr:protein kinase [Oxynema aestuarii]QIZ69443.1 protein kinase [Oxynema aestuarii AP17]